MEFEEAYREVKEINDKLEKNQIKLEKSIDLYKRATGLIKLCREKLKEAEGEIEKLKEDMDTEALDELDA